MARGLSDLQKWMLIKALEGRRSGRKYSDLEPSDIKIGYYGLKPARNHPYLKFRKTRGWRKYESATAAIRRATVRLRKRGLIASRWPLTLSEAGVALADKLMVQSGITGYTTKPLEPKLNG